MAVSELRQLCGVQLGEQPANQLRCCRVKRDNADIEALAQAVSSTCDPFDTRSSQELLNLASGKAAKEETRDFLLSTLKRGEDLRTKFASECEADSSRFLKTVSRTKILNFAAESSKVKASNRQADKPVEESEMS